MRALEDAINLFNAHRLEEASRAFEAILQGAPGQPVATHFLGLCRLRMGHKTEAIQLLADSVQLAPQCGAFYNNYALALAELGELENARIALQRAVELEPNNPHAHNNLGTILQKKGLLSQAVAAYRTALAQQPGFVEALNNLATALGELGRTDEAIDVLEKQIGFRQVPELHFNLGKLYLYRKDVDKAVKAFRRGLELRPGYIDVLNGLASALNAQGKTELAIETFTQSLRRNPTNPKTYLELGNLWKENGRIVEALECYQRSVALDEHGFSARWNSCLAMPVIYRSQDEISLHRQRWKSGLRQLTSWLESEIRSGRKDLPFAPPHTNFYLHYQAANDLCEQRKFASVIRTLARNAYPALARPLQAPPTHVHAKRHRIGFLTCFFSLHTVFKLFHGWIKYLSRDVFEVFCFHVGKECDKATEFIRAHSDNFFFGFESTDHIVRTITESELDVLIFLEIGMDPLTQSLAALRFAPVQCMAWGHPVTSGLPSIDFFLSSELMEPTSADAHYSEKLVRLPGLSICYPPPDTSIAKPIQVDNSSSQKTKFVSLQSLFKLLPQYDEMYPQIAIEVPNAEFWFIALDSRIATDLFRQRLRETFARFGLDADNYVRIFPKMNIGSFFGFILAADIILDSIGWSGGNTTLEALGFGKPIVTLPGEMMRSRHTLAILRLLDCNETVANSVLEYERLATQLARDLEFRKRVECKIRANRSAIYNDFAAVKGLERFLHEISPSA